MKKRFALIIGAPRCGTTRLFRLLGSHPQVLACRVKEPRFFSDDRKWALGIEWYRTLWDFREPDERIAIEASSDYACHPGVPSPAQRIARTPAGFRLIYLLRDPWERIASQHAFDVAEGRAEPELDARTLSRYLDASRYASQLEHYRRHFPREDVLLLSAEAMARDPRGTLQGACRFLEIDPFFGFPEAAEPPLRPPRRAGRLARWAAQLRGRWRPPARGRRGGLDPALRAVAARQLDSELARLEAEWGFDVSGWRRSA